MIKYLHIALIVSFIWNNYLIAQEGNFFIYGTDTVYSFELVGKTRIRDNSKYNLASNTEGFQLYSFKSIECINSSSYLYSKKPTLVNYKVSNDTIFVSFRTKKHCCISFLGEIEYKGNNTLNLRFIPFGEVCECFCPYELKYTILTKKSENLKFEVNGKSMDIVRYNFVRNIDSIIIQNEDYIEPSLLVNAAFENVDENGEKEYLFHVKNKKRSEERVYFSNGKLKSITYTFKDTASNNYVFYFLKKDKNGKVLYEKTNSKKIN